MTKGSAKKTNKAPSSSSSGPASSPSASAASAASTWMDNLSAEDRKLALCWSCNSPEEFQTRRKKMADQEKKAAAAQKTQMWENAKKETWEKQQASQSRKNEKESQKTDKQFDQLLQQALKQQVVQSVWGDDDKWWAHIDNKDWREVSDEYYCTLCDAHLNYATLQSHCEGTKHTKNVNYYLPSVGAAAAAAPARPPPKAPPGGASAGGYPQRQATEEWMESNGDGTYKCLACSKQCTDEHLAKEDHKNRVQSWRDWQETLKSGYQAPKEEHMAFVNSDESDPGSERWKKCLLCSKFAQDEWSHAGCVGDADPKGSKEHLKNLRNYEWHEATVREGRLRWHPETARATAAPTQSRAKAAPAGAASMPSAAPWAKPAPTPKAAPAMASAGASGRLAVGAWAATSPAKAAPVTPSLPPGWEEARNEDGVYYWHPATSITQWERPTGSNGSSTAVAKAPPASAAASDLPAGWQEVPDDEGSVYYWHADSNKTQWDKPTDSSTSLPASAHVDLPPGWEAGQAEGETYYFNSTTGASSWEVPTA